MILRTPGQIRTLEFNFRFVEDTEDYKQGDNHHTVMCNIKGTDLARTKLELIHYRGAEPD